MLHIRLLGDFLLLSDDIPVTTVSTPRLQSLFAYLVLHSDAPQSRNHLAFLLWPESAESQAQSNLRKLLYQLRQALPDCDSFLRSDSRIVQWLPDGAFTLDVADFEKALAVAATGEQEGRPNAATAALQEAVSLYRGELLPSCYDDWILPERERLNDRFQQALERVIELLEAQRDYRVAITYAQRLLRYNPLHEATYRRLMEYYAAVGNRAEALRVYQTCVGVLQRELDVEPSASTRQLYDRLSREEDLVAAPVAVPATPASLMPAPRNSFIGREGEIAAVRSRLQQNEVRLITLTGPPGIGKTRLALEAASGLYERFPDGIFFVPLAPVADPALVIPTVTQVVGVREASGTPLVDSLKAYLREKRLLLLLDNFEQVIEAAPIVSDLLVTCAQLKVLVTSREALRLYGEHELRMPALEMPGDTNLPAVELLIHYDAMRLFIERATSVKPDLALSERNILALAQICRQLEGLPLAIELAANRIKHLSPQALASQLSSRLQILTGGARDLPLRQQTLRSAIEWSYNLLPPAEQAFFRRLGVFIGGCTLEAAQAVAFPNRDSSASPSRAQAFGNTSALDILESLVDKSLLQEREGPDGEPRYSMLEMIREYALEQLASAGELHDTQREHASYFTVFAEEAEPKLRGSDQATWVDRMEAVHNDVRSALQWTIENDEAEMALRLAVAMSRFWQAPGLLGRGA